MAYRIKINKEFKVKSQQVYKYLLEEWNEDVADNFTEILYTRIDQLALSPFIGLAITKNSNVRRVVITKHNKLYYRVNKNSITILSLFFSRQNPRRNKFE